MAFNGFLDPVLGPLLSSLGTLGFVALISLLVSLLTVIVYKYATDQVLMKHLKGEIDRLNKEARKNANDHKKAMSIQKEMFSKQMVMMKHSMTPTLITFLPIIVLFSWLNMHLGPEKVLNLYLLKLGWLGSYILFAIVFSIILRKLLKVY
jgi:uncharacterized membrane protein (DUF106 family)